MPSTAQSVIYATFPMQDSIFLTFFHFSCTCKVMSRLLYGVLYFLLACLGHGIGSSMWDYSFMWYPWEGGSYIFVVSSAGSMFGLAAVPVLVGGIVAAISYAVCPKRMYVVMVVSGVAAFLISCPAYINEATAISWLSNSDPETVGLYRGILRSFFAAIFQTLIGFSFPLLLRRLFLHRAIIKKDEEQKRCQLVKRLTDAPHIKINVNGSRNVPHIPKN